MTKHLLEPFMIRGKQMRNRVGLPPMVMFAFGNNQGLVTEKHIEHYRNIAQGGVGFIVQEATCVTAEGRLSDTQLGIWSDEQIPGLAAIVEAVHAEGCPIFLQIHHAGVISIAERPMAPSVFQARGKTGHAMSLAEIKQIQTAFVEAAKRAVRAGYDGVELHGCHSYLMSQFLNKNINKRDDIYGQERTRFVVEIFQQIKKVVPTDFIVGIRLGGFEATLEDAITHALILEAVGLDFLDISYGFSDQSVMSKPEGEPLKDIHYAAREIKKLVKIPVFAVNGIRSVQQAKDVLALTNVDAIHLGKNQLVDAFWIKKVEAGIQPGKCIDCVRCHHYTNPDNCPGRILLKHQAKHKNT